MQQKLSETCPGKGEPLVITQNGEAKIVIQETLALLKILALGTRQIEEGKVQPARDVIQRLRDRNNNP